MANHFLPSLLARLTFFTLRLTVGESWKKVTSLSSLLIIFFSPCSLVRMPEIEVSFNYFLDHVTRSSAAGQTPFVRRGSKSFLFIRYRRRYKIYDTFYDKVSVQ